MSLENQLENLAGSVGLAASDAPDQYPSWSMWTYETHKADLCQLWKDTRAQLVVDVDKVLFIDRTISEMFAYFDAGDKERGRKAAWAIYNLDLRKLR